MNTKWRAGFETPGGQGFDPFEEITATPGVILNFIADAIVKGWTLTVLEEAS